MITLYDPAYRETERIIAALEYRLNKEYAKAIKEVQEKLDDYLERFKKKDDTWRAWVNDVKDDKKEYKKRLAEYQKWRTGQIAVGKRWREMRQSLAEDYTHTNEIARSIALEHMPDVYALNHNYGTFEVEKGSRLDTSYTLYDRSTVEYLLRDNPELLPHPGKDLTKRIYNALDVRWNRQQIQAVMLQSLLQGESIPQIATRLSKEVGEKNRKAAIRDARTMATGAQNAGRIDSYRRAEAMGIKMRQQWLAAHDGRTRHSHRMVDYEIRAVGEMFSNGCRFPGDPSAPPAESYNCRCALRGLVDGLEPQARKYHDFDNIEGMTYDEWKKAKSESNPITLPEEKGEAIRNAYIAEYRHKAASVGKKKK